MSSAEEYARQQRAEQVAQIPQVSPRVIRHRVDTFRVQPQELSELLKAMRAAGHDNTRLDPMAEETYVFNVRIAQMPTHAQVCAFHVSGSGSGWLLAELVRGKAEPRETYDLSYHDRIEIEPSLKRAANVSDRRRVYVLMMIEPSQRSPLNEDYLPYAFTPALMIAFARSSRTRSFMQCRDVVRKLNPTIRIATLYW